MSSSVRKAGVPSETDKLKVKLARDRRINDANEAKNLNLNMNATRSAVESVNRAVTPAVNSPGMIPELTATAAAMRNDKLGTTAGRRRKYRKTRKHKKTHRRR